MKKFKKYLIVTVLAMALFILPIVQVNASNSKGDSVAKDMRITQMENNAKEVNTEVAPVEEEETAETVTCPHNPECTNTEHNENCQNQAGTQTERPRNPECPNPEKATGTRHQQGPENGQGPKNGQGPQHEINHEDCLNYGTNHANGHRRNVN